MKPDRAGAPAQGPGVRDGVGVVAVSTLSSLVAMAIGTHRFQLGPAALALFPITWAVVIDGIVGVRKIRPITPSGRSRSTVLLEVGIVMFLAGHGAQLGPSLSKFAEIGQAIVLQESGHIICQIIIALPVAVGLGLGGASIGATGSIDRESCLALVAGLAVALMNALGAQLFEPKDLVGIGHFIVLTPAAFARAKYAPSVPSSAWVLALGTLLSAPFMPTAVFGADVIGNLDVITVASASLALIGTKLGRGLAASRPSGRGAGGSWPLPC